MSAVDPQFVEKIVHEVKSQGVFDEFRKDSMADVDTKPAYQNLRQRVEAAVKKFLSEQKWSPDTNKNQLRERLRKHITESGFLDVGVERIVDQVVNPKIGSVFQPKIEEIAYKYLGIAPPIVTQEPNALLPLPPLPVNGGGLQIETANLLPNGLELISPDSDKVTVVSDNKEELLDMDIDDKLDDDDESPPFEPLVKCNSPIKSEAIENVPLPAYASQRYEPLPQEVGKVSVAENINAEIRDKSTTVHALELESEKGASPSLDAVISQGSQLSQISSESQHTTSTHGRNESGTDSKKDLLNTPAVSIMSEEAQMPKFSENSSEAKDGTKTTSDLHFDIKKDEIKFEGTDRKSILMAENDKYSPEMPIVKSLELSTKKVLSEEKTETKNTFQFNNNVRTHSAASLLESSLSSSLEDTDSKPLFIDERNNCDQSTQGEAERKMLTEPAQNDSAASLSESSSHRKRDKNDNASKSTSSSSSSRHKKHSKDKKHSHDKDRTKRHEREKSSDRHSKSRHSSSSSKISSEKSKSSHQRSDGHYAKHDRRSYSKHHRSSSHKESVSSSSSKKSDRKGKPPGDDHNESKGKLNLRKSTDSNGDGDKNSGGGTGSILNKSPTSNGSAVAKNSTSNTESKNANGINTSTVKSSSGTDVISVHFSETNFEFTGDAAQESDTDQGFTHQLQRSSKVVILNDILENPTTDFVELEATSNHVQVVTLSADVNLLFFEANSGQFTSRLKMLDDAIFQLQSVVNSYHLHKTEAHTEPRGDDNENTKNEKLDEEDNIKNNNYRKRRCASEPKTFKRASSLKRFKNPEPSINKLSPTPSDSSCNSKENVLLEKNTDSTTEAVIDTRINIVSKISHQRYMSEDLYKPRPILSQRSRRRGVDSCI